MELKKPFLFFWKYNQQENSKSSFMKAIYIYVALISMSLFLVSLLWTLHDYKLSKEQYLQSSAADFEKAISIAFANHYEKGNESIDDYQQFSSLDDYTIAIFENGGLLLSTANFPSTKELENAYSHFEKMSPQLSHQKIELQKGAYLYLMIPDGSYECIQFIPANEYDWFGLSAPSFIYGLLVTLGVAILSVFFFSRYICLPFWRLNEFILNLAADKKDINRGEMEMYISLAEEIGIMPESMSVLFSRDFNSRLLLKQAELDALQSQINPHFLYNTLDTIRGLALSKHDMDIAKMTKALASFFRYSVSMTNPLATVNEEIQNVKNYFIILQYRFDDRFSLEFDFKDDEEAILKTRIPKFTLQPIVENGIKHGLESRSAKGIITIGGYIVGKNVVIEVKDNGTGIEFDKLLEIKERLSKSTRINQYEQKSGLALTNVNDRVKLMFGEEYGLNIFSTLNLGTRVEITFPIEGRGNP